MDHIETGSFAVPPQGEASLQQVRIVSWNIARGCRLDAVLAFLDRVNADLILLQEVDSNARRTGFRNVARDLSQKLRMNYAFGIEFQELGQGTAASPAYHGQATLSPWRLSESRILRFSRQTRFWSPYRGVPNLTLLQRRLGGRIALVTRASIGSRSVVCYNLHLESRADDHLRLSQLQQVLDDARQYDAGVPVIVAGDFNVDLRGEQLRGAITRAGFDDHFTTDRRPTTAPGLMERQGSIDSILTRGVFGSAAGEVVEAAKGSDHYPLLLTVTTHQSKEVHY